jgi:hypothetical protein
LNDLTISKKMLRALLEAISRLIRQMNNCHIRLNHALRKKEHHSDFN